MTPVLSVRTCACAAARATSCAASPSTPGAGEVVALMGLSGSGKTTILER